MKKIKEHGYYAAIISELGYITITGMQVQTPSSCCFCRRLLSGCGGYREILCDICWLAITNQYSPFGKKIREAILPILSEMRSTKSMPEWITDEYKEELFKKYQETKEKNS